MKLRSPFDHHALQSQIKIQSEKAWNFETEFSRFKSVDAGRFFVPLDFSQKLVSNLSPHQARIFSQYLGLAINETISEMEDSLITLKQMAWAQVMNDYPVNPEMRELGTLFLNEEAKHSQAFKRYKEVFCKTTGTAMTDLDRLLPKAFGSKFLSSMHKNLMAKGSAIWWVVAQVEEVSVLVYRALEKNKDKLDPYYFHLHRVHAIEELRHESYAFLMLRLIFKREGGGLAARFKMQRDLLLSETTAAPWVLLELTKLFRIAEMADRSPFFKELAEVAEVLSLQNPLSSAIQISKNFPYASWLANPQYRTKHKEVVKEFGLFDFWGDKTPNYKSLDVLESTP